MNTKTGLLLYVRIFLLLLLLPFVQVRAQDSTMVGAPFNYSSKQFSSLNKKATSIEGKLDRQTTAYLSKLQKQEKRLQKKLWKKDSTLAKELFSGVDEKYAQLSKAPEHVGKYASVYSGHLDSLTTSLNFLKNNNLTASPELQTTLSTYTNFQSRLNQADAIKKYIKQRQQLLKEQLSKVGMLKELKGFQKQAYYYSAQVSELKQTFEDPSKLEAKLMEAVLKVPEFKDFFQKNSQLGALFALPGSNNGSTASLAGLQTRASVNQALVDRFGSGPNTTQMLRQNLQAAQGELNQLKNKVNQYSSGSYGSGGDVEVPEGFKPNQQKTKSFLKRLEYGTNLQTARSNTLYPVTSDLGLSLGYKLSDKSSVGVGASYKLGWGSNWDHIKITHQGVGLRSYLDYKLKGSLFLSGGYEQNYRSEIHSLQQLKDQSAWQSSGLIGLSKKYKVGKLKGDMKLLWDFMSYQQIPRTQAIVFRVGYSLK